MERDRTAGVFDRQRGYLFEWSPVAYAAGIALYFALPVEPSRAMWAVVGALFAAGLLGTATVPRLRTWPVFIGLVLVLAGLLVAGGRSAWVAAPKLESRYYGPVVGRVVKIDRSQSDAVRLTLDRVHLSRRPPDATPDRVRLSLHGEQGALDPAPGQVIMLTGHLAPPAGPVEPGGYDFRRQAWFDGIGAVGYTRTPALLAEPPGDAGPSVWLAALRHRISVHVRDALPGPTGGFAAAITTGDRSGVERGTLEDLRLTNLAHLLAISGLHMGLLTGVVFGAARLVFAAIPALALTRPVRKWAALIALVAGAGYLALSGGNVATERAFIMVAVVLGAVLLDRRAITLRAVAVAALIVLTLRPEALYGPGFQMSFAATTALVAVWGGLRDVRGRTTLPRVALWIGAVALSSLIAGLATGPVAAAHFNRVPHYGLVANVLSVPVMGLVIMPAAVAAAVLAPVGLDGLAFAVMGAGIRWILAVADWVAGWPGAVSHVVAPGPAVLPLLALAGVWAVLWRGPWRAAAFPLAVLAMALWTRTERPDVLVSETGRLVGVMTAEGRALSKAKGGGFAARVWLENDGDAADQAGAAARWTPSLADTLGLVLEAGRGAGDRAVAACGSAGLIVTSAEVEAPKDCPLYDAARLDRSGAVALYIEGDGLRVVSVRDVAGRRPWTD